MESDRESRLSKEEERLDKLAEIVPAAQLEDEVPERNAVREEVREHLRGESVAITGETAGRVGENTARRLRTALLAGIVEPVVFVQKVGQLTVSYGKSVMGNIVKKISGS